MRAAADVVPIGPGVLDQPVREPLQLKGDKGEQGNGRLTSATTVSAGPPWNMLGVLYDGAIEWSNGTKWRKQ
jgi:hypothetical protein